MGTVTGTIYKGSDPWPDVEVYFDIVRVFSDGVFSYPATRLTTETDASGEIEAVELPTPDNGSIQVRLTFPSRETILFWHSTADGDITIEDIILGAGSEVQIDTLQTLLTQYLKLIGGTMTGPLDFSGTDHAGVSPIHLTTAERDALTPAEGMFIYNETDSVFQAYQGGAWVDYGSGGGGAVSSVFGRTGAVVAATSDYDAVQVDFTPAGTIAATNVQAAIEEVAADAADDITGVLNDLSAHTGQQSNFHGFTSVTAFFRTLGQQASAALARGTLGAAALRPVDRDIAGTTHTFELTDESKSIRSQSGSATVFTVPLNSAVAFPVGTIIGWAQKGTGELSFSATGGVTVNSLSGHLKAAGQHAEGMLRKTDTNVWDLVGALKA